MTNTPQYNCWAVVKSDGSIEWIQAFQLYEPGKSLIFHNGDCYHGTTKPTVAYYKQNQWVRFYAFGRIPLLEAKNKAMELGIIYDCRPILYKEVCDDKNLFRNSSGSIFTN